MDLKDTEFIPVIENGKQLYDAYPELFDEITVDNSILYLEKPNPNKQEAFAQENRVFILPSGVVSVTTKDLDFLWSVNETDTDFLKELNVSMETTNRQRINESDFEGFQIKYISGIEYGIKHYFFMDEASCTIVMDELDKKTLARKGLPPRR